MDKKQYQELKKYTDLMVRCNKFIIGVLLLSICCGLVVYFKIPKVYQSTALLMYEQSKINPSKLSPDQERRIEVMVNTVTQQVTSRTSLEAIIKHFNLYQESLEKLPLEDVVAEMRDKQISITSQRKQGDIFSVSFQSNDRRKAMQVTNTIAAKFIEENLRFREERAAETTAYVNDELSMAKEFIGKKDEKMRDYKLKYYNEMPEQRVANMNRLNALQEQSQAIQSNIQSLEQTRLLVQQRYEELSQNNESVEVADSGSFEGARQRLKLLLTKYTVEHPSVIQLQKMIAQMEAANSQSELSSEHGGMVEKTEINNRTGLEKLAMQFRAIELNLKGLREQNVKIVNQVKLYQGWIANTPLREAEWASITRDYKELEKHYEYLVSQSLAAESAESLERRQKGSQFRIVDSAYLPEKPLKPDFVIIMFVAIGGGLAGGVGLVLVFGFFDTSFKEVDDIEDFLEIPVVCAIPVVRTPAEKRKAKVMAICWYTLFSISFGGVGSAIFYLWQRGLIV